MSSKREFDVPLEIIEQIFSIIAEPLRPDYRPRSQAELVGASRAHTTLRVCLSVSKIFHYLSCKHLFRTIKVYCSGTQIAEKKIACFLQIIQHEDVLASVRDITFSFSSPPGGDVERAQRRAALVLNNFRWVTERALASRRNKDQPFLDSFGLDYSSFKADKSSQPGSTAVDWTRLSQDLKDAISAVLEVQELSSSLSMAGFRHVPSSAFRKVAAPKLCVSATHILAEEPEGDKLGFRPNTLSSSWCHTLPEQWLGGLTTFEATLCGSRSVESFAMALKGMAQTLRTLTIVLIGNGDFSSDCWESLGNGFMLHQLETLHLVLVLVGNTGYASKRWWMPELTPATNLFNAFHSSSLPKICTLDVTLKFGIGSFKTRDVPDRRDSEALRQDYSSYSSDVSSWESFDDVFSTLPSLQGADVEPLTVDVLFTVDVLLPPGASEPEEIQFEEEAAIWHSWQTEQTETRLKRTIASHVRFSYKQHISYF